MRDVVVIVTASGAPGGPGIIKSLQSVRERNIKIITVDMQPRASGLYLTDESYIVPSGTSKDYVETMLHLANKTKADFILPLSSLELMPLAKAKKRFQEDGIIVLVSEPESLEIALNKFKSYEYLYENGISVPDYFLTKSWSQFESAIYELGYPERPVCFKPPISRGARGFRILREDIDSKKLLLESKPDSTIITLGSVKRILEEGFFPDLLVMEYLPGVEYSTDSLTKRGETLVSVSRHRNKTVLGISNIGVVEDNAEARRISKKINDIMKFSYCINVQTKYSVDGVLKIIEINPRVSGTICLCTAAGVNLPYFAIKSAMGEPLPAYKINFGTTMIRHWAELYLNISELKEKC